MKIFIDDVEYKFDASSCDNLGEVVSEIAKILRKERKVISSIKVDGEEVDMRKLSNVILSTEPRVKEVEIKTLAPLDIAYKAFIEVKEKFLKIKEIFKESAYLLTITKTKEGFDMLKGTGEVLQTCYDALLSCFRCISSFCHEVSREEEVLTKKIQEQTQRFKELNSLSNSGDIVAVSDFLEYELAKDMDKWGNYIDVLIGYLDKL